MKKKFLWEGGGVRRAIFTEKKTPAKKWFFVKLQH